MFYRCAPTYLGGRQKLALSPRQSTEGTKRCVGMFKATQGMRHQRQEQKPDLLTPVHALSENVTLMKAEALAGESMKTPTRGLERDVSSERRLFHLTCVWVTIFKTNRKGET